ncbi:Uncharacterised protein [Candidatus Burarchaeum australiense]|nr:Uncharacterised protein [Candidatus Burarchaeum australiense]
MKKFAAIVAIVLLALGGLAFADIGPGPDPAYVMVTLTSGGAPYAGEAAMTYLCSKATERKLTANNSVEPIDVLMACEAGKCIRGAYYKFNPCFYSNGSFELAVNGKTVTSREVYLESPGNYEFSMDVNTGALNASPRNPQPPGPGPAPNPAPAPWYRRYCCCSSASVLALLPAFAYMRSRK